jgi:hypothetical protein
MMVQFVAYLYMHKYGTYIIYLLLIHEKITLSLQLNANGDMEGS